MRPVLTRCNAPQLSTHMSAANVSPSLPKTSVIMPNIPECIQESINTDIVIVVSAIIS